MIFILVEIDLHFRGAYFLHHQGDETTWHYIPDGCHFYACHHENLKSHKGAIRFFSKEFSFPSITLLVLYNYMYHRSLKVVIVVLALFSDCVSCLGEISLM
jgi:hypothetical protein